MNSNNRLKNRPETKRRWYLRLMRPGALAFVRTAYPRVGNGGEVADLPINNQAAVTDLIRAFRETYLPFGIIVEEFRATGSDRFIPKRFARRMDFTRLEAAFTPDGEYFRVFPRTTDVVIDWTGVDTGVEEDQDGYREGDIQDRW